MSSFTLSDDQRSSLQRFIRRCKDATVRKRTRSLLKVADGALIADVARREKVHRNSIHNWIQKYRQGGEDALYDIPSTGRPPLADHRYRAHLRALLDGFPDMYGHPPGTGWTIQLIQHHLAAITGTHLCNRQLRKVLHDEGYVYKLVSIRRKDAWIHWSWIRKDKRPYNPRTIEIRLSDQ